MIGALRIGKGFIEIDDGVEVAWGANPLIDGLAIGFVRGWRMVVVGIGVGQNRCSQDLDMLRVGAGDDLFIRRQDAMDKGVLFCMGRVAETG